MGVFDDLINPKECKKEEEYKELQEKILQEKAILIGEFMDFIRERFSIDIPKEILNEFLEKVQYEQLKIDVLNYFSILCNLSIHHFYGRLNQ